MKERVRTDFFHFLHADSHGEEFTEFGAGQATVGAKGHEPLPTVGVYRHNGDGSVDLVYIMHPDSAQAFGVALVAAAAQARTRRGAR